MFVLLVFDLLVKKIENLTFYMFFYILTFDKGYRMSYLFVPNMLRPFMSTTGENIEERTVRENTQISQGKPFSGPYTVHESTEDLIRSHGAQYGDGRLGPLPYVEEDFKIVVIDARGDGKCSYNSLYMFMKMHKGVLDDTFDSFYQTVRKYALLSVDPCLRDIISVDIDDPNAPNVIPIIQGFVNYFRMNVLLMDISNNRIQDRYKFVVDEPTDYIILLKNSGHIKLVFAKAANTVQERRCLFDICSYD
jgi:hypothetical protein